MSKEGTAFAKATEEMLVKREASLQRHIARSMIMTTPEETEKDLKEIEAMEKDAMAKISEKYK